MTRFETINGESLGVTFSGGKKLGKLKFLTSTETKTLWSLDNSTDVISDNGWSGTVGDLKDLLFTLKTCSNEEMIKRGWGDKLDDGLHLTRSISVDGKLIWTR